MRFSVLSCLIFVAVSNAQKTPSQFDLTRAAQKVPGIPFRGSDHLDMVQKLNHRLVGTAGLSTKPCETFTVDQIITLQKTLYASREPQLQEIYSKTKDNRRLAAAGQLAEDLVSLEKLWSQEQKIVEEFPNLHDVIRDGKCHEAVMWWVHHTSEATKNELKPLLTIPLMAEHPQHTTEALQHQAPDNIVARAMDGYKTATSCGICHATSSEIPSGNTESKEWPEELSYNATGYGAFPFWDHSGPGCSSCQRSIAKGQKVRVLYSAKHNAEVLMHTACGNMSWTGAKDYPASTPCNHLFTSSGAFIYTPKSALVNEADGKFCCQTYKAGDTNFPGPVPQNWMRSQTLYTNSSGGSTVDGFSGDYYSGPVKIYWSIELGVDFWYYESSDGTPVEQGEGCYFPGVSKKTTCNDPLPVLFYHDYDTSTFKEESHDSSEFDIPDVCKGSSLSTCTAPGGASGDVGGHPYYPVHSFHARAAGVGPKH